MNKTEKEILQNIYPKFKEDLEPRDVLLHCRAANHITEADYEVVNTKVSILELRILLMLYILMT